MHKLPNRIIQFPMLQDSKTLKDLSIFSDDLLTTHTVMYRHYSEKILFERIDFLTGDHN